MIKKNVLFLLWQKKKMASQNRGNKKIHRKYCTIILIGGGGTRWRSRLRHYATSRRVAGSIPNFVIEIFHLHNPSGRTMAAGSFPDGVTGIFH
jgi:hypothetical protein